MKPDLVRYLIIGGILALVALAANRCYNINADEWERRVLVIQKQVEFQKDLAKTAEQRADKAEAEAAALASEAQTQEIIIRERIDSVFVQTPVELRDHPAIVKRDEIIAELIVESSTWKSAYEAQLKASVSLRVANSELHTALDSTLAVLEDRPTTKPWWIPSLGFGPFVGVCTEPKPCAGVGVTVSWSLKV